MIDLIRISRFSELTGYTDEAVRGKIAGGVWLEDVVWIKAPDGRILISIKGYELWAGGVPQTEIPSIRSRCADALAGVERAIPRPLTFTKPPRRKRLAGRP